jgi:hypothetical protein
MRSIPKTAAASAAVLAGFAMLGTPGAAIASPGNNGTVKVAPYGDIDAVPNNTPHVGCVFQLEWYGFDAGVTSKVSFAEQAPTTGVGMAVSGPSDVPLDNDPGKGAGNDGFDGTATYTLSFTGAPHPQQGYHVSLTIDTPESNGATVKHKVFWVEGCAPATPTETPTPTPTETVAPATAPPSSAPVTPTTTSTPATPVPTSATPVTPTSTATPAAPVPTSAGATSTAGTSSPGNEAGNGDDNGDDEIEVMGVQASAGTNVGGQQASQSTAAGEQQAVPTSINAGATASTDVGDVAVLLALTALAALLGLLALIVHRRGARAPRDLN